MMKKRDNSSRIFFSKSCCKIKPMGPEYVVKKGEHGALCFTIKKCFAGIAIRRGFDPTGAGDTFAGGFAGFITRENVSSEKMPLSMVQIYLLCGEIWD
jgi:sugar/nucleoside kinase (ribokinase family)